MILEEGMKIVYINSYGSIATENKRTRKKINLTLLTKRDLMRRAMTSVQEGMGLYITKSTWLKRKNTMRPIAINGIIFDEKKAEQAANIWKRMKGDALPIDHSV